MWAFVIGPSSLVIRRAIRPVALASLMALGGCQPPAPAPTATPAPTAAAVAPPTPGPPPTAPPAATVANPALERRPVGVPTVDPFPRATTTVAGGQALLWAPWPMEGRDLRRTNRSPIVGPRIGQILWSVEIDEPSFGQIVEGADGTLYVGTETGKVQAVKPREGVSWSFAASRPVPTPAIGPDGTIYARGGDGTFFALRPDGRRRWTTDIGAEPKLLGPAPLVGPDSYAYLTSYHQGLVYVVQPGGFFQWAANTQARTPAGPAVGQDGTIYVGVADGSLRAIDREAVPLWRADVGGPVVSSPAVADNGDVHVLTGGGGAEMVAVDPSGRVKGRTGACWGRGAPVVWAAVAPNGRVQVGPCAIGPDGAVLWSAALDAPWTTPALLDADDQAFLAAGRTVYALDRGGKLIWRLDLESAVLRPPSLGSGGTLYLAGARPNRLYAIGGR